ncbi:hypothetical protein [Tateyamaria sp.]|uniref:hypothetical protein n=1 Tax=Tateyamaria sp. TaxID=1929288 RepID=UPI003B225A40
MATYLYTVVIGADVIGIVDHPMAEPQKALFDGFQMGHVGSVFPFFGILCLIAGQDWAISS